MTIKKLILPFIVLFFVGCGTISMQTFAKSSSSIFFESLNAPKTIYFISKNSSYVDSSIGEMVKEKLLLKGYKFTEEANSAQYILRINTVDFNKKEEQTALKATGAGAVTGAIVGGASTRSIKGGAITGAIVGAGAGIFALATEDGTVKMQSDVYITEKVNNTTKDYETRIFAEATQMHLSAEKAQPILEEIISTKISGIFL